MCHRVKLRPQVEQHNRKVQQGFAQQMDGAFSSVQRCVQQQGTKHHDMLSSYSQAIGETRRLSGSSSEGQECLSSEISGATCEDLLLLL